MYCSASTLAWTVHVPFRHHIVIPFVILRFVCFVSFSWLFGFSGSRGERYLEPLHLLRSAPDRPLALVSPFPSASRVSLIRLRIHGAAHTPGVAGVGLTVVVYEAPAEVYEPGVGGIFGTRRRRPITGRLDVVKGMA